jgi:PadR family transcriptional regulator, regulatory protein AphA
MASPLSPFSYAVMAVVGRDGASGSELVQMAAGGAPFFWTGAASHVLRTARRLADDGYLSARTEPAKTRPRTVYELTDKGHEAVRDWLAEPSRFPGIQHEAAIRLWASDLGDIDTVLESLRALHDELPRLEALCDFHEQRAHTIPHRTTAIMLNHSLARRLIQAHQAWIDEVEAAYTHTPARHRPQPAHLSTSPRASTTGQQSDN